MAAISSITAQLITPLRLGEPRDLARFLDVLEQDAELSPTHWGETRGVRDPYDRAALLAKVAAPPAEGLVPEVRGARPLRWSAYWYRSDDGTLGSVQFEAMVVKEAAEAEAFFAAMTRVAGALPLEFGAVDVRFLEQPKGTALARARVHHLDTYARCGPDTLYARSFFGRRLLALMGNGAVEAGVRMLAQAEGLTRALPNGAVQLDLVDAPWRSDAPTLKAAQQVVDARLRSIARILARENEKYETVPGDRWVPPSAVARP